MLKKTQLSRVIWMVFLLSMIEQISPKGVGKETPPIVQIVGGTEVLPTDVLGQSMAYILSIKEDGTSGACGGTIIDENHILTAAHCFGRSLLNPGAEYIATVVFINSMTLGGPTTLKRTVSKENTIIHPQYNKLGRMENDITILKLNQKIDFSAIPTVKMATLAQPNGNSYVSMTAKAMGWGRTQTNAQFGNPKLLEADLKVDSEGNCGAIPTYDHTRQLCTAKDSQNKATCYGDSGGPIFVNGVQIGITSFGKANECEEGAVFTRVSAYFDWIKENTDQPKKPSTDKPTFIPYKPHIPNVSQIVHHVFGIPFIHHFLQNGWA